MRTANAGHDAWRLRLVALAVGCLSLLAADAALAQRRGGILKAYHRDNPPSASIHEEATISTAFPFMPVFNNLVLFDQSKPLNGLDTVVPELAERWEVGAAGTQVKFTLRPGVTWHDGKPFTAKDVVCTWDLVNGVTEGARKSPRKIWYDNVEKVTADGDLTATFHLRQPQPSLLILLASGLTPVYPCHVDAKDMRSKPIGTGPFKVVEFERNKHVKLVRSDNYWRPGRPYLDGIEYTIIPSRSTRILAFAAGEFDMTFVADITIPLLKDVQSRQPKALCKMAPSGVYANVMVNRDAPPFDNPAIRTALTLALDRKTFGDILGEGKLPIGGAMMPRPSGLWGMPDELMASLPGYAADVERSRAEGRRIMEGLGYTKEKPLRTRVTTRELDIYKDPAVLLVDQLRHVNIETELIVANTSVWYNVMQKKDYTVALNVTGVGVDDPDANFVENYLCKSERNYTRYCNPEVDRLISAQSRELDLAQRKRIVWEIERKLVEDAARPVIHHSMGATCWYPHVKGFTLHENSIYNNWRLDDVWLDR